MWEQLNILGLQLIYENFFVFLEARTAQLQLLANVDKVIQLM